MQSILHVSGKETLAEDQCEVASRYLSMCLAISDREKLIHIFCRSQPDLLTATIKSLVTAYEPIIRALHRAADLSDILSDLQTFLSELITLSTWNSEERDAKPPTVEEYYRLLEEHVPNLHKFLHQACRNSTGLKAWYQAYTMDALSAYQRIRGKSGEESSAGDLTQFLETLMDTLSDKDKRSSIEELKHHRDHLSSLREISVSRFDTVVSNLAEGRASSHFGPGMYLANWQEMMAQAVMIPGNFGQELQAGAFPNHAERTTIDSKNEGPEIEIEKKHAITPARCPAIIRLLSLPFRRHLEKLSQDGRMD